MCPDDIVYVLEFLRMKIFKGNMNYIRDAFATSSIVFSSRVRLLPSRQLDTTVTYRTSSTVAVFLEIYDRNRRQGLVAVGEISFPAVGHFDILITQRRSIISPIIHLRKDDLRFHWRLGIYDLSSLWRKEYIPKRNGKMLGSFRTTFIQWIQPIFLLIQAKSRRTANHVNSQAANPEILSRNSTRGKLFCLMAYLFCHCSVTNHYFSSIFRQSRLIRELQG